MSTIRRINFKKTEEDSFDFEIIDLKDFFNAHPARLLSKIFRLNFYMILYITSGKGKHEIDFKVYDFNAGDIIFISRNQVHRFFPDIDAKGYVILFTEDYIYSNSEVNIDEFLHYFNMPLHAPILEIDVCKESSNRILIDLLYKEYKDPSSTVKKHLIKSLLRSFMLSVRRFNKVDKLKESSGNYKRFIEFKNLVDKHYKKRKTVQEYAKMMLVSQKTINQATRIAIDISAKQFIINRIILEIKRYLGQGELTINEISDLMGFDEPSNLTKFFKRYEGVSPKEFRTEYLSD